MRIDLDQVLEVALRGVRRASVFMGLGVNAALSPELKNYQLTDITKIQLLPDGMTSDGLAEAKNEFRIWIEANGFRELIETFHAFLDATHLTCLKIKLGNGALGRDQLVAEQSAFAGQGFPNKLNILEQKFGISIKHKDHLVTLNCARNVFTHRLSIVRKRDLNAGKVMQVSWMGLHFCIKESNGNLHPIDEVISECRSFPEETTLVMRYADQKRSFMEGDRLVLSSRDLAEICFFMANEAKAIFSSLISYAKASGVEIRGNED